MSEQLPAKEQIKTDMRVSIRWTPGMGAEVRNLEMHKPSERESADPSNHQEVGGQSEVTPGNQKYQKRKETWDREHRDPVEEQKEVLPLEQLTDALTLEIFYEACSHLGTQLIDVNGHQLSGQFIKESVERAEKLIVQKRIVAAARELEVIPGGPLLDTIEALLHQNGLRKDMQELRRASGR